MKNNLADLNNHLFSMLERLGDDEIINDDKMLNAELSRAKAMCGVSKQILEVARVQVTAIRTAEDCGLLNRDMPALIAVKDSAAESNNRKLIGVAE